MVYNRFLAILLFRVLLMLLTSLAFAFIVFQKQYWFTALGLIILMVIQVYGLLSYLNKSNEFIARFVNYLREENTNFRIPQIYNKPPYDKLIQSLHETGLFVKKAMLLKEHHYHYLQYIINTVGVGLIVFFRDGKVDLINPAAKDLLNINSLSNIKELNAIDEGFEHLLFSIKPGEDRAHKVFIKAQIHFLSFKATEFKISDKSYKLIAFQNIREELDEKEMESWQTLIRVLSHELMNTITPVNSLTRSLVKMYRDPDLDISHDQKETDTKTGLELISDRVSELLTLVDKYKILSRIPIPSFKPVNISQVTKNIIALLSSEAIEKQIKINYEIEDEELIVMVDEQMISQVLINILRNAMDAAWGVVNKNISIKLFKNENRVEIHITDHGKGIPPEEMDKVFIPFYTTKEQGSGIGLSLSRQLMRLHKGSIRAVSIPDEYTTFIIII